MQLTFSDPASGQSRPAPTLHLQWVVRVVAAACGLGLLGMLIVARVLQPEVSGLGTHRQLKLPECGVWMVTGQPCPSCGMTTAWAHATRGNLIASAQSNAGGLLLACSAMVSVVWLLGSAIRGQWIIQPHVPTILMLMMIVVVVTLGHWLIKISI